MYGISLNIENNSFHQRELIIKSKVKFSGKPGQTDKNLSLIEHPALVEAASKPVEHKAVCKLIKHNNNSPARYEKKGKYYVWKNGTEQCEFAEG